MNRFILVCFFAMGMAGDSFCNDLIANALRNAVTNSCVSERENALSIREWGVPDALFSEPTFTNLVSVLSANVSNCDAAFVCNLTNIVERDVFVAALTECGPVLYGNAVTRWFGDASFPCSNDVAIVESFICPTGTNFENYMPMHYDTPGISNVLNNAKIMYQSMSNNIEVIALERILSGSTKQSLIQDRDYGLIDRIRDGSSR